MEKNLMLIVNPVSGKGQVRGNLFDVISVFAADGYVTHVYMTQKRGDATELAAKYGSGYDLLVCIGGDGTLSEVISGLVTLEKKPALGYIPMGTANDVATTLHISRNAKGAAEAVLAGNAIAFDVGRMEDRYFSYIAAFGAFTDVSYTTPQENKRALGHLAYILEGLSRLPMLKHYHARVEYDGGDPIEGDFIFGAVTNSTSIAGLMKIKEDAVALGDGEFEVILIEAPSSIGEINNIANAVLTRNFSHKNVTMLHTGHIRFIFDEPVPWTRDGESGGTHQTVQAENMPRVIRFLVPAEEK